MTNEQFWKLMDTYEEMNKNNESYVPKSMRAALRNDIITLNNGDFEASVADYELALGSGSTKYTRAIIEEECKRYKAAIEPEK